MKAPWSLMPLLLPTAMLAVGIVCGMSQWWLWIVVLTAISALVLIFTRFKLIALAFAFCAAGALNSHFRIPSSPPFTTPGTSQIYQGTITRAKIGDTSQTLTVHVTHSGIDSLQIYEIQPFDATLTIPSFDIEHESMYDISFCAELIPVTSQHDIPDEITSADIQLRQGIFLHAVIPPDSIKNISPTTGWIASLRRERTHATQLLLASNLSPHTKEFLCTALLGDPTAITSDVRSDFTSAGLAHILALSGLHVGLIAMLVSLALWPAKILRAHITTTVITIILLWGYAAFTGMGASVVRAVLMLSIYLGAKIFQRRNSGINSLCFAAIVILFVDPSSLFSIGFQLSFAAVAAILIFADALNPVNPRRRLAYNAMSLLCVSISAMIGTALISCYYFHTLPVYFLLANLCATILLPWLIGGGVFLLVLEYMGVDPLWMCKLLDMLYFSIERTSQWIATLPSATLTHLYQPAWLLIPYSCVLAALRIWIGTHKPLWGTILFTTVIVTGTLMYFAPDTDKESTLYVTRTTYHTNLIANIPGHRPLLITTSPRADISTTIYNANRRYFHFLGKRGYDSLTLAHDSITVGTFRWKRPWLHTAQKSILLASSDSILKHAQGHAHYLLVCRGYRQSIASLVSRLRPDSVVLSYDLHPKRAARYAAECDSLHLPYRNMRSDGPWSLPISSR